MARVRQHNATNHPNIPSSKDWSKRVNDGGQSYKTAVHAEEKKPKHTIGHGEGGSTRGDAPGDPSADDHALSKDVSEVLKKLKMGKQVHFPAESKERLPNKTRTKSLGTKVTMDRPDVATKTPKTSTARLDTSGFICHPTAHWYTSIQVPASTGALPITPAQLSELTSRAASLQSKDVDAFQASSSSSESTFLNKIVQSGTLSDRLSALTLLVQSSPVHNTRALETLKGMAERGKGKSGREESLKALRCVVDWWVGGGVPNKKLKYFRDQPLSHASVTDQHLVLWYFEDWLKKYFFAILQILEAFSLDPLSYVRMQTLSLISTLLCEKPEQEQNLLRLLVNKLGDVDKSVCSRASYHTLQLLQSHPSMKEVVVREIVALVLRPPTTSQPSKASNRMRFADEPRSRPKNKPKPVETKAKSGTNSHARYYASITFNQIVLTPGDKALVAKLIDFYFDLFKELLNVQRVNNADQHEGEGHQGDNASHAEPVLEKDKKGRVMDRNGKGKMKMAAKKGAAGFVEVEDEHSKLVSAILTGINRALPFAKMDGDSGLNKHIETLFLITHTSTFNISLQALSLIQHISGSSGSDGTSKSITDRYYRALYASLHDARLASSSKQAMYLNLLFKSIKSDLDKTGERPAALVRRFVQVLVSGGGGSSEFTAGGLYLMGELFSSVPGLKAITHRRPTSKDKDDGSYDPGKRDPQYAQALSSPAWELTPLLNHYHPSVSLHSRQLLSSQILTASADLSLNTLSNFLERFVYKNAKQAKPDGTAKGRGSSAMQPAASASDGTGVKLMKGEQGEGPVNSDEFLKKKAQDVPVDKLFFHKYFVGRKDRENSKASKSDKQEAAGTEPAADDDGGGDSGEGEQDDSMEEAEVWKAMKATMTKLSGDDDLSENEEFPDFIDDSASDDEGISGEDDSESDGSGDQDTVSFQEMSEDENNSLLETDAISLIEYEGSDNGPDEEGEWAGIDGEAKREKRKRDDSEERGRRKKLKSLPTFASYEDYASMIERDEEDV